MLVAKVFTNPICQVRKMVLFVHEKLLCVNAA